MLSSGKSPGRAADPLLWILPGIKKTQCDDCVFFLYPAIAVNMAPLFQLKLHS